ncbi:MAG: hyaD 2, partial [Verrucomicrobia bacterium]|nr:hyaD 2 [Verrucomicrobiota bacterium]
MDDQILPGVFRELIARGLILAEPAPRQLGLGNLDRRDDAARSTWQIALPAGGFAKLTVGRALADLASRHAGLAQACPDITAPRLFFVELPEGDAMAETFFEGPTLELAVREGLLPPESLRETLAQVARSLAATEQLSTETARTEEWAGWVASLLTLPVWQAGEKRALKENVLPALYVQLALTPPVTRWTTGAFLPANILVNPAGGARLVDPEFAARTHFFLEDYVRFRLLSGAIRAQPTLADLLPEPPLAWHLYFWLRQFQLEAEHNTPAYLARVQPGRLGVIRRLAEQILDVALPEWSVPAIPVHYHLETARWRQTVAHSLRLEGWCHVPDSPAWVSMAVWADGRKLATTAAPRERPDVRLHFGNTAGAGATGFSLEFPVDRSDGRFLMSVATRDGLVLPFHAFDGHDLSGPGGTVGDYPAWAATHDADPAPPVPAEIPDLLISVILPVHNTPEPFLRACIDSVRKQHYPRWELCVVDDGSTAAGLDACLREIAAAEPRIKLRTLPRNLGIAGATNAALTLAIGDYVMFLDHDDLLRPHALLEIVRHLRRHPELDALYSDEDIITTDGRRILPFLKPDFSQIGRA